MLCWNRWKLLESALESRCAVPAAPAQAAQPAAAAGGWPCCASSDYGGPDDEASAVRCRAAGRQRAGAGPRVLRDLTLPGRTAGELILPLRAQAGHHVRCQCPAGGFPITAGMCTAADAAVRMPVL
jgi:hypothetical protein